VDALGEAPADAGHRGDLLDTGVPKRAAGAEDPQERPPSGRADAREVVECRPRGRPRPDLAVRLVGLAECGTHALVEVAVGPCTTSEQALARDVVDTFRPGMLVLADRGFYGFRLWEQARAGGADLLWRAKSNHVLPVAERLADGSYRSTLHEIVGTRRRPEGIPVRVIEYALADDLMEGVPAYRLLTTVLDATAAPAQELAAVYAQRWELETVLDELKTHQRGPRLVLRSKLPAGVIQELYGYLCVHYAIRWLMHAVALDAETDPDRLSFTRTLRVARRTTASHPGFSPSGP